MTEGEIVFFWGELCFLVDLVWFVVFGVGGLVLYFFVCLSVCLWPCWFSMFALVQVLYFVAAALLCGTAWRLFRSGGISRSG